MYKQLYALTMPAFVTNQAFPAMETLRERLREDEIRTYRSNIRVPNIGSYRLFGQHVKDRLKAVNDKAGHAVTLVGFSLGGIKSCHLAHVMPEEVGRVITLGTPLWLDRERLPLAQGRGRSVQKALMHECFGRWMAEAYETGKPVPDGVDFLAIVAKRDRIVAQTGSRATLNYGQNVFMVGGGSSWPGYEEYHVDTGHILLPRHRLTIEAVSKRIRGVSFRTRKAKGKVPADVMKMVA